MNGAQTRPCSDYSKLKTQNPLKIPKKKKEFPSHPRMKKLLLVATVLVGGMAFSHAGLNINIGLGIPLPRPAVVIRQPVAVCPPPVVIVPPACPPRVIRPCPPVRYEPCRIYHKHGHGYDRRDYRGRKPRC